MFCSSSVLIPVIIWNFLLGCAVINANLGLEIWLESLGLALITSCSESQTHFNLWYIWLWLFAINLFLLKLHHLWYTERAAAINQSPKLLPGDFRGKCQTGHGHDVIEWIMGFVCVICLPVGFYLFKELRVMIELEADTWFLCCVGWKADQ